MWVAFSVYIEVHRTSLVTTLRNVKLERTVYTCRIRDEFGRHVDK